MDDVHIIGYELDWNNPLLDVEVKRARDSKSDAYKKLCLLLNEKGFNIDFEEDILKFTDNQGKLCFRKPEHIQKKHIFEALALNGSFASWEKAKLYIRNDASLNINREKISPLDAIDIIKASNGISVLAHPYLIDETVSSDIIKSAGRYEYILELINRGLDGIEACYTYNKTTYKGTMTNDQIREKVIELYGNKVKFFTGGSDYHNDSKKGVLNPRNLGEAGISYREHRKIF